MRRRARCTELKAVHEHFKTGLDVRLLPKADAREWNLFNKALGDPGAKGVAAALKTNSVQRLDLGANSITDVDAEALAAHLPSSLTKLWLYSNKIGDAGLKTLAQACEKGALAHLKELTLDGNNIGSTGLAALAQQPGQRRLLQDLQRRPDLLPGEGGVAPAEKGGGGQL